MWFKFWDKRERAVRRGIKLLNQQVPNWWQHINPDHLDMSDPYRCVLGRLATAHEWDRHSFSPYGAGATRLRLYQGDDCRRYGFDVLEFGSGYAWLTERWSSEVQKRQLASINN